MSKATKYVYFFGAGQTEGNADMRNLSDRQVEVAADA